MRQPQTMQTETPEPMKVVIDFIQLRETADGWAEKVEAAKPAAIEALKTLPLQKVTTGSHEASIVPTGGNFKTGEAAKALGFKSAEAFLRHHLALKGIDGNQFVGETGETVRVRDL